MSLDAVEDFRDKLVDEAAGIFSIFISTAEGFILGNYSTEIVISLPIGACTCISGGLFPSSHH